jgi:hypothetical protein
VWHLLCLAIGGVLNPTCMERPFKSKVYQVIHVFDMLNWMLYIFKLLKLPLGNLAWLQYNVPLHLLNENNGNLSDINM